MFGFAKKLVSSIESQLSNDNTQQSGPSFDESRQGLRILAVKPNSIGSRLGLESWFDFIVALNGTDINAYLEVNTNTGNVTYDNFLGFIKHEVEVGGNDITFTVFSSKGSVVRDLTVSAAEIISASQKSSPPLEEVSLSEDSGTTSSGLQWTPSLGVSFQLTPLKAGFFTWHVLRVLPGSPAYIAGILPDEYIIQSQDGLLATGGEDILSKVLQSQYAKNGDNCEVVLYVYNYESDCVRPARVILRAGSLWGGRGILGCDVGYGLLHRIPEVIGKFYHPITAAEGLKTVEQPAIPEIQLTKEPEFLPLQVSAPSFASAGQGNTVDEAAAAVVSNSHRKKAPNSSKHANINLDAYFDEQSHLNEDKSKNTVTHEGSVPPPPKKQ